MSASVNTAPAQAAGWGRFPTTLAALALVVILAVAVAIVALNGTKAAPAATGAKGAPPPAVIDHSYSSGEKMVNPIFVPSLVPANPGQTGAGFGGFAGPRVGGSGFGHGSDMDPSRIEKNTGGHNGPRMRPQ